MREKERRGQEHKWWSVANTLQKGNSVVAGKRWDRKNRLIESKLIITVVVVIVAAGDGKQRGGAQTGRRCSAQSGKHSVMPSVLHSTCTPKGKNFWNLKPPMRSSGRGSSNSPERAQSQSTSGQLKFCRQQATSEHWDCSSVLADDEMMQLSRQAGKLWNNAREANRD